MNDSTTIEPSQGRPQRRKPFLLISKVVCLFGLAAITVHFAGMLLWPYGYQYYFSRRESWVERLKTPPQIIFMGSSTVLFGISPSEVQTQLGLSEGSVINLSLDARSPLGSNCVWDREDSTLSKAKIVVYGLDPWILSEVYYKSDDFTSLHYSVWQAFYQALHPPGYRHLNLAAFGGPAFLRVLHGLSTYSARVAQSIPPIPPDYGAEILRGRPLNFSEADHVRNYFGPYPIYAISDLYLQHLSELKRAVEASGARFVLLLPPKRQRWAENYRANCRDIDSDVVAKLNRYLGPTRIFGSFDLIPAPLESDCFRDDFHLSGGGQRLFSKWIAEHLYQAAAEEPALLKPLASY